MITLLRDLGCCAAQIGRRQTEIRHQPAIDQTEPGFAIRAPNMAVRRLMILRVDNEPQAVRTIDGDHDLHITQTVWVFNQIIRA